MREPTARRDQREIVVPARNHDSARNHDARPRARARLRAGTPGWFAGLRPAAGIAGRAILRHPGEILGVGVVLGAVSMICLNALGYQVGRHPAPIFPKVAAPGRANAALDKPRPAPAIPDGATAEAMKAAPPKGDAKAEAPARTARDGIGEIIRAADPKNAETTASVAAQGAPSLVQAQRALVKLGYGPLKADGLMGAGTRAAIERFERDRKLPVKGEPSPRVLRELAARAAVTRG